MPAWFAALAVFVSTALGAEPVRAVQAFVKSHCVDCHDADMKKGGFDLTALPFELGDPAAFHRWVHVFDRVSAGEMPPKTEERPPADELRTFLQELRGTLHETDAMRIAREGRVRARRLTRFEYERTVHDLLGIDTPLLDLLPEDPRGDGFDTVSAAQAVSHHLLEKYLAAVDVALDSAFAHAFEPASSFRVELGWPQLQQLRPGQREPGPRTAQQDVVAWSVRTAFHGRIPMTKVPESGWYRVSIQAAAVNPPAAGEVWCSVRSGVCFASAPTLFWVGSFAATSEVREHTFEAWIQEGHQLEIRPHDSALKRGTFGTNVPTAEAERTGLPGVAIKTVTIERFHRGPAADRLRERLFPGVTIATSNSTAAAAPIDLAESGRKNRRKATPSARGTALPSTLSSNPRADAARWVRAFAARAFRQPVSETDAAAYVALAHAELDAGATLLEAVRGGFRAILSSPRFLYLEEAPGPLSAHALAARLSYFLWSTTPDDELRALADNGRLNSAPTLRAQVERMLRDPRAGAFVEHFTDQWLNLADIDFTVPDAKLYPEFDEVLKHAMVDETRGFFRELLQHDLSVSNLVDSNFTLMNSRLARHYRIAWPGGAGLQRVALRADDHRGGVITHGSVLKVTANGTNTSPVIRGVWMLERIMGVEVPPVPADVPAIEPDIRGAKTIREQLDKHRNVASCAACHVKIDPPGFALENYDVTGGWRDHYRIVKDGGKGFEAGPRVDPSYVLPDGRNLSDVRALKRLLLADRDQLARNLAAKLVTYATGAEISFADRAALDEIIASTKKTDHGVASLVHAVVHSRLFRHK
jgi:hypothetical protein